MTLKTLHKTLAVQRKAEYSLHCLRGFLGGFRPLKYSQFTALIK